MPTARSARTWSASARSCADACWTRRCARCNHPVMRTSDRARERTVALLRRRCGEGYLSLDTFERRVEDVYRARSAEQLAGLSADLPASGVIARLRQWRLGGRVDAAPQGLRLPLELVGDRPL